MRDAAINIVTRHRTPHFDTWRRRSSRARRRADLFHAFLCSRHRILLSDFRRHYHRFAEYPSFTVLREHVKRQHAVEVDWRWRLIRFWTHKDADFRYPTSWILERIVNRNKTSCPLHLQFKEYGSARTTRQGSGQNSRQLECKSKCRWLLKTWWCLSVAESRRYSTQERVKTIRDSTSSVEVCASSIDV